MHRTDANEVVELAQSGPLLRSTERLPEHPLVARSTEDLDEAERIAFWIFQDPAEAKRHNVSYLPDRVAHEQGKLHEYGTLMYSDAVRPLKEEISEAVHRRFTGKYTHLANELEGLLCAIVEARLARGKSMDFFESVYELLCKGWLPLAVIKERGVEKFAIYSGGAAPSE